MGSMTSSTVTGDSYLISMGTDGTLNYVKAYSCEYLWLSLAFDSATSSLYFECSPSTTAVWIAKVNATDGTIDTLTAKTDTLFSNYVHNVMLFNPVNNKLYFNAFYASPDFRTGL